MGAGELCRSLLEVSKGPWEGQHCKHIAFLFICLQPEFQNDDSYHFVIFDLMTIANFSENASMFHLFSIVVSILFTRIAKT